MPRSTKSFGRKFDVNKALRATSTKIPRNGKTMGIETYISAHSRMNTLIPTTFIINGKKVGL
jgi:hypothetical protein